MATAAAVQAALDPAATGKVANIVVGPLSTDAVLDEWYVFGGAGCKTPAWTGKWVQTTRAASAAAQAAAILTVLNT